MHPETRTHPILEKNKPETGKDEFLQVICHGARRDESACAVCQNAACYKNDGLSQQVFDFYTS
jgi:hypothetical protein